MAVAPPMPKANGMRSGIKPSGSTPFTGSSKHTHTNRDRRLDRPWGQGGPTAGEGVVIQPTEAYKAEIAVMQAASKADGDTQVWIGILNYTC